MDRRDALIYQSHFNKYRLIELACSVFIGEYYSNSRSLFASSWTPWLARLLHVNSASTFTSSSCWFNNIYLFNNKKKLHVNPSVLLGRDTVWELRVFPSTSLRLNAQCLLLQSIAVNTRNQKSLRCSLHNFQFMAPLFSNRNRWMKRWKNLRIAKSLRRMRGKAQWPWS